MSRHQNYLKQAQEIRNNKFTLALKKRSQDEAVNQKQFAYALAQPVIKRPWGLSAIITFSIILFFIVTISVSFTLITYASKDKESRLVKKSSQIRKTKSKLNEVPMQNNSKNIRKFRKL